MGEIELEAKYPYLYPEDFFTSDILEILTIKFPDIKERIDFLNNEKAVAIRAVDKYVRICNEARIAFPKMVELAYKYRSAYLLFDTEFFSTFACLRIRWRRCMVLTRRTTA